MKEFEDDVDLFRKQLETRFNLDRDTCRSWNVQKILSNHVLIHVYASGVEPGVMLLAVWAKKERQVSVWHLEINMPTVAYGLLALKKPRSSTC